VNLGGVLLQKFVGVLVVSLLPRNRGVAEIRFDTGVARDTKVADHLGILDTRSVICAIREVDLLGGQPHRHEMFVNHTLEREMVSPCVFSVLRVCQSRGGSVLPRLTPLLACSERSVDSKSRS
jgi:hypothetical protein